jgi:hypothetical protein
MTLDYDPYPDGHLNGGASGGPYGELYPTSTIIGRYMYPGKVTASFNYRHLVGENYRRRFRWQGALDFMLYGSHWAGADTRQQMLADSKLPLSRFYPERGKFTARSDWRDDAMYMTFDARPDAHLIGHDKVDRGNFSMSALGRVWAFSGDFHRWDRSDENSLVRIDGRSQAWKAPAVRFLWFQDVAGVAGGAADLKYAYDWQWTPPWPQWGERYAAPWEPETSSAVALGWPAEHSVPELCPDSLHGSQTGYAGRNNLHRRPFNPVQKAIRSAFLVRREATVTPGAQGAGSPFMLVCDDIRKDDADHLYEWVMQLPTDLSESTRAANEIVLAEADGDRRLLVRVLNPIGCAIRVEDYEVHTDHKRKTVTMGRRLVASQRTVEPGFRVLLWPHRAGEARLATAWNQERTELTVTQSDGATRLSFSSDDAGATRVRREPAQ